MLYLWVVDDKLSRTCLRHLVDLIACKTLIPTSSCLEWFDLGIHALYKWGRLLMAEWIVVLPRRCEIYALNNWRCIIMIQSIFFRFLLPWRGIAITLRFWERSKVWTETELVLNQVLSLLPEAERSLNYALVLSKGILERNTIFHWVRVRIELSTAPNPKQYSSINLTWCRSLYLNRLIGSRQTSSEGMASCPQVALYFLLWATLFPAKAGM